MKSHQSERQRHLDTPPPLILLGAARRAAHTASGPRAVDRPLLGLECGMSVKGRAPFLSSRDGNMKSSVKTTWKTEEGQQNEGIPEEDSTVYVKCCTNKTKKAKIAQTEHC